MTSLIIQGSGSIAYGTASVVASEGLIVAAIDNSLSDTEKLNLTEVQLQRNRANCEGIDQVASALTVIFESSSLVCKNKYDDDCDQISEESKSLIIKVSALLQ